MQLEDDLRFTLVIDQVLVSGVDYMESSRRVSARRMAEEDDRVSEGARPPTQDVPDIRRSVGDTTNNSATDASNSNRQTTSSVEFRTRMTPP